MRHLTNILTNDIPALYQTENVALADKVAHIKLYHPIMGWSWYIIESDGIDDCFGLVVGIETELGYFSLQELAKADWYGVGVEKDFLFKLTQLQDLPLYNIERVVA